MRSKYICGIRIDEVDKWLALKKTREILLSRENFPMKWITSINPEKSGRAMADEELRRTINHSFLTIPDGIGIVWAARMNGIFLKERIPGIDFAWQLLRMAWKYKLPVYLYGAKPENNICARKKVKASFPGISIVGSMHGYEEWEKVALDIVEKKPVLLLVAMGGGKQEKFIWTYKDVLPVKLAMGVGGSFDVWAGKVERAPIIWQSLGMEWLYRIIKEPMRIPRLKYGISFMLCSMQQLLL